ncbi:MAG: DUF86 domain-containing protein [Propionibacteriaceae bacterium]|nr:DUF86 domain-containing protein [Propionibacteriaceae bacterium]
MTNPEKVVRWLADLASFADQAAYVTACGKAAYMADDAQGSLLRNAGERVLIKVATVVERLPSEFTDLHPDIAWRDIARMRNLVAHHYDHVDDDLMWNALVVLIPALVQHLGLTTSAEVEG